LGLIIDVFDLSILSTWISGDKSLNSSPLLKVFLKSFFKLLSLSYASWSSLVLVVVSNGIFLYYGFSETISPSKLLSLTVSSANS
jgi:hypothetical protein